MEKIKKKMLLLILIASLIPVVLMAIVAFFPSFAYSDGGCPPNDTCPSGWKPVPVHCYSNYCDDWAPNGYCILCKKHQN